MVNNQVTVTFGAVAVRSYFGGRLVGQQLGANIYEPVIQDRLGSVGKYYPYGEERNSPQLPNDQVKFATYTRDSATGNDYADQRYYTSVLGRFMTPDPYRGTGGGSGDANNPQSWNRYAYVIGDPINWTDSSGQFYQPPEQTPNPPPPPFVDTSSPPSNQVPGKAPKQNLPNSPIPCPPVPQAGGLPAAASAIIAQNVALAQQMSQQMSQQFFQEAEQDANSDPDAPVGLIYFDLMANWLVQQFSAGGAWDYKAQQDLWAANAGTTNLQNFGNFNFGAVMQSLGLSYYLTQNAAGIYHRNISNVRDRAIHSGDPTDSVAVRGHHHGCQRDQTGLQLRGHGRKRMQIKAARRLQGGPLVRTMSATVAACALTCCSGACRDTLVSKYPSPDGRFVAVVFYRNCGATTAFTTEISVVGTGEDAISKGREGNIFSIRDPNDSKESLERNGTIEVRLDWKTPRLLSVSAPRHAWTAKRVDRIRGVDVQYNTF